MNMNNMKKIRRFAAACAAILFAGNLNGQPVQAGRPNVEFLVGGGAPFGGMNLVSGFSYAPNVAHEQSGEVSSDNLALRGTAGAEISFAVAQHWAIRTGIQATWYGTTLSGSQLWSGQYLQGTPGGYVAGGELFQNLIQGFKEKDKFIMAEVPVMIEYSTPVGRSGHRFYLAGGAGIGKSIVSSWSQEGEWIGYNFSRYMYPSWEKSDIDPKVSMLTYAGEGLRGQYNSYESASYSASGSFSTRLNGFAAAEIGFRWRLTDGIGLYTGIYARYGLNNFVMQDNEALVTLRNQEKAGSQDLVFDDVEFHSALTALAPSYVVETFNADGSGVYSVKEQTDHYIGIGRTMAAGIKLAFSFGKAYKAPAPVVNEEPVYITVHDTVMVHQTITVHDTVMVEIPAEIKEAFAKVNFDFDKASLTSEAKRNLDRIADWLVMQNEEFVITGHCDGKGSEEYNLDLSRRRCVSVVNYLVDKGVQPEMLSYKGYGKGRPIEDNVTDEGRAENRRVEIFVKGHNPYEGQAERGSTYNSDNQLIIR